MLGQGNIIIFALLKAFCLASSWREKKFSIWTLHFYDISVLFFFLLGVGLLEIREQNEHASMNHSITLFLRSDISLVYILWYRKKKKKRRQRRVGMREREKKKNYKKVK